MNLTKIITSYKLFVDNLFRGFVDKELTLKMESIIGTCMEMCHPTEVRMRITKGLLHKLESGPGLKPVKEFKRSAAGVHNEKAIYIRPPDVLQTTVTYLINNILTQGRSLDMHNFVINRLLAVKQDLFKQQCTAQVALPILEPIARYYAWSAYWYSEEAGFDCHNHDLQLLECLKYCIKLSDECNFPPSMDIEAMYILHALGNHAPLNRVLEKSMKDPLILQCFTLSEYWMLKHYVAVCIRIKKLPLLLASLTCVKHLENVRRLGLEVMSSAYSCKNTITPVSSVLDSHLFATEDEAEETCHYYGITITNGGILFRKSAINAQNYRVKPFKRPVWIQEKLESIYLPHLLLCGTEKVIG